jgi:hypothetical protein
MVEHSETVSGRRSSSGSTKVLARRPPDNALEFTRRGTVPRFYISSPKNIRPSYNTKTLGLETAAEEINTRE